MARGVSNQRQSAAGVRRHRPDYQIVLYMGLLMLLGLIVMYAIGPQRAQVLNASFGTENYSDTYFFFKQAASLGLALAAFWLMSKIPLDLVARHSRLLVGIAIASCIFLAIGGAIGMSIVQCSLGACRWFDLGAFGSLQPAEFLKFSLLLFVALLLAKQYRSDKINDLKETLMPIGVLVLVGIIFVIGFQKDMGTGISLVAILATMLFVAGLNRKLLTTVILGLVGIGILFIVSAPHRIDRVTAFFAGDQGTVQDAETYHITHAKIAIGSGGLTGVGIGNSIQATGYLPEAINDSVFAIMGETFGFIGLMVILGLFTALLMRLLKVADHLPDIKTRLIVVGIFGWLAAHIILNIASMTGIFPLTGITLPLLSFGGTSMIFIAGALGLAFQLSRYTVNDTSVIGGADEDSRGRWGLGRTRNANRSRY